MSDFVYKIADSDDEFDAIHRLNYETFVEEIPQHESNPDRRLVDKFHAENTYLIALKEGELAGMIAVRGNRPFSLDQKLGDIYKYLPKDIGSVCEARLLAVRKEFRRSSVVRNLLKMVIKYCVDNGYEAAVISGVLNQVKLYRHLGFKPFGPVVGDADARFQPMILYKNVYDEEAAFGKFAKDARTNVFAALEGDRATANFLPGPVAVSDAVAKAFAKPPISHRSLEFIKLLERTKSALRRLSKARDAALMLGSGTLANDAVAGQLSLLEGRGLILVSGEFGRRLVAHAEGFGLDFTVRVFREGDPVDIEAARGELEADPDIEWLWMVHCETSTGVLNDLPGMQAMTDGMGVKLCVDVISSLGLVDVDLSGVYLATCVSGKALGSYPGVAIVFHNHGIPPPSKPIPRYLNLHMYSGVEGVPYTASSNLLAALHAALESGDIERRKERSRRAAEVVRAKVAELGFEPSSKNGDTHPCIVSVNLPKEISSLSLGRKLAAKGFLTSYESAYLVEANRLQVCFLGETDEEDAKRLVEALDAVLAEMGAAGRKA